MTAHPLRAPAPHARLRVLSGRRTRRPTVAPWLMFSLVAVISFLGLVMTRTALDRSAIDLASLERRIAEATTYNQQLKLEIARLESPARVVPLAGEMGMVYPEQHHRLVVEGVLPEEAPTDGGYVDAGQTIVMAAP
jgi:cell division protein FtsL